MKKISFLLVMAALTSSAIASPTETASVEGVAVPPPAQNKAFSGGYAGATLGYNFATIQVDPDGTHDAFANTSLKNKGIGGGLVLGYGNTVGQSPIYLGAEFTATFDGAKGKKNVTPQAIGGLAAGLNIPPALVAAIAAGIGVSAKVEIETKLKNTFSLVANLGGSFGKFMPYLSGGFSGSMVDVKASMRIITPIENFSRSDEVKKFQWGPVVGAGFKYKITPKVAMGLNYTCTFYGPIKDKKDKVALTKKWNNNRVMASVVYLFSGK